MRWPAPGRLARRSVIRRGSKADRVSLLISQTIARSARGASTGVNARLKLIADTQVLRLPAVGCGAEEERLLLVSRAMREAPGPNRRAGTEVIAPTSTGCLKAAVERVGVGDEVRVRRRRPLGAVGRAFLNVERF